MSTVQFQRLPRLAAPRMPGGEVHLEPPPEVPRVIPGNIMQKLLPGLMLVAVLGMVAYMSGSPGALPRQGPLRTGRAGFPRTSAQASPMGVAGDGVVGFLRCRARRL